MGHMERAITSAEAAERLGRNQRTVRRWAENGPLDGQVVGDRLIIAEASVVALERRSEMILRAPAGEAVSDDVLGTLRGELERTEDTIGRLGAAIATHPEAPGLRSLLRWERSHRDRITGLLERYGQDGS
jgi:hypothetical protein